MYHMCQHSVGMANWARDKASRDRLQPAAEPLGSDLVLGSEDGLNLFVHTLNCCNVVGPNDVVAPIAGIASVGHHDSSTCG